MAISLDYRRQSEENRRDRRPDRVRIIADEKEPTNIENSLSGLSWGRNSNRDARRRRESRQRS